MAIKRIFRKFIVLINFLFNLDNITFSQPKIFLANNYNNKIFNSNYFKKIPSDDYILVTGDSMIVKVSEKYPELHTVVTLDKPGSINLPNLKRVFVKELTINELIKLLNLLFNEFLKYPKIGFQILKYRPTQIFIYGELENPFLYGLSNYVTLEDIENTYYFG